MYLPRNNAQDCSTKVLYEQYLISIAYIVKIGNRDEFSYFAF